MNAAGRTYEVERHATTLLGAEIEIGPTQTVPWHYHTEAQETFYVVNGAIRVFTRALEEEVCLNGR